MTIYSIIDVTEKRVITCFRFQNPIKLHGKTWYNMFHSLENKITCFNMFNVMAYRTIMFFQHGISW